MYQCSYIVCVFEAIIDETLDDGRFPDMLISKKYNFIFDFSANS